MRTSDAPSYAAVADALTLELSDEAEVRHMSLTNTTAPQLADAAAEIWTAAVAIGADAAELLIAGGTRPLVICQAYQVAEFVTRRDAVYGVAALPPPALQVAGWKSRTTDARRMGIILSAADAAAIAGFREAGTAAGIDVRVEFASTDREALYRFKRLARDVDGLLLFPDSDILSPSVLREMFSYAREHDVDTLVFNPALLEWGASISLGSEARDVATTVATVVAGIHDGRADELPSLSALSTVEIRTQGDAATITDGAHLTQLVSRRTRSSGNAR